MGPFLLHSVSYSGSWGQAFLGVEEFIDKAAELGYQGVMLMAKRPHLSVLDWDAAGLARLRSRIEARGLTKAVIAGYTNFTADLEHAEVPTREMQIAHVVELGRLARALSPTEPVVRIFTGYEHSAAQFPAQWNMVVAAIRECARRTADHGVTIGVQNHHDIAAGYEAMHDLVRAVAEPNCRALFDAWSPALHGDDLGKAAKHLAPLTVHTTVADYQLRPRYRYHPAMVNYTRELPAVQAVPMGDGFIDYGGFLGGLGAGGFEGSVAYEMCSPLLDGGELETLDRYGRRFLEYMEAFRSAG